MLLLYSAVQASEEADNHSPEPVNTQAYAGDLPLWEAGVLGGGISQPAYPGADVRISRALVLPYAIYRGKYLRIDRETVGVRAIKTPRVELDVGFGGALGSRASDIEARHGMDDLGLLVEFGPRVKINLGDVADGRRKSRIQIALRGVFDVNDHLSYHGNALEPQWVNELNLAGEWLTTASVGAVFGDQQLVDTFYRVTPAEATPDRPAYSASSGLISLRASVFATRLIGHDVRIFGYLRFDSVDGAANHASPLVRRDNGWTAVLGMAWTLAYSERAAND